jgi:hypothetical protein
MHALIPDLGSQRRVTSDRTSAWIRVGDRHESTPKWGMAFT